MDNKNTHVQAKFLQLLSVLCSTLLLICLVLQNRLILMGSIYVCATVFIYPFIGVILDIIAEIYGYQIAKKILWLSILSTVIFSIIVTSSTLLPGPGFWNHYTIGYNIAMSPLLRVVIAGTCGIILGQYINIYIITKLKVLVKGRYFSLRCMSSSIIGDTVTFVIALIGFFVNRMNAHEIFIITISELIAMYVFTFLFAFPGNIMVILLKQYENQEVQYGVIKHDSFVESN